MKIPLVCLRMTAYHSIVASPVPWMRNHGREGGRSGGASPAAMSWCCVAM